MRLDRTRWWPSGSAPVTHRGATTAPEGDTVVDERTDTDYRYDEGDHERFSHYAPKNQLMQAMVEGKPVRALCGKLWVPTRDPKRFPVCPQCKEIYASLSG